MTEKLLQYLWNYKVFNDFNFKDDEGNSIEILDFGKWNTNSGPDFLMAKIKINNLVLVGNIELHIKSSDWVFHKHSKDPNYQNIILHVVYQKDVDLDEFKSKKIPTLELKNHIDENIFKKYDALSQESTFIPCEKLISQEKLPFQFHEENLLKKLEEKSLEIEKSLQKHQNNYEAILFHTIAYAFGLKVNAEIFRQIAESIDFSIVNKIRQNETQLEALFFGISGWLENPLDEKSNLWKREFEFLKTKFKLQLPTIRPQFLRLRPPNFPTLRLSQLANLYHTHQNLFSKIVYAENINELQNLFQPIIASGYWDNHYNFGKLSTIVSKKSLSKNFIEIIILNAILPFKYTYFKHKDENTAEKVIHFYKKLSTEKNIIVDNFKNLNLEVRNALESQSFYYQYKNLCSVKNCLNCSIGFKLLKEA